MSTILLLFAVCGYRFKSTEHVSRILQCTRLFSRNTVFMHQAHFSPFELSPGTPARVLFDGASNMSRHVNGVQAKLKAQCPDSLYIHCSNHTLDLVLQEVARDVKLNADTLNFVQGVSAVLRESSKRKQLFQSLFGSEDVVCNVLGLRPTRWCIRTTAIS